MLLHGGDLGAARRRFPHAPEPFIDLSTGINPHSFPVPHLPSEAFTRLPEPAALDRLATVAAETYGAPSAAHVVPAPGTQILLPLVAALVAPGRAAVLGPSYAEFVRTAGLAGHDVTEVADLDDLRGADLAILANPNNPDGRRFGADALLDLADAQNRHAGVLVVDEAFMDGCAGGASLGAEVGRRNVVVLRSFGKFYGLAGVRLGFALAAPPLAARLSASLGPWAVSGPAIAIGEAALGDAPWADAMRARLDRDARRLDALLAGAGLEIIGGTPLFRLARTPNAQDLFHHLGRAGILARRFDRQPSWLRLGLPGDAAAWDRLAVALAGFPAG